MAKLSAREQAAKAKGGSLNYKTGKITVAPKIPVRKPIVQDFSMNPEDAPQTTQQYESRIASGLGNAKQVSEAKAQSPKNTKNAPKFTPAPVQNSRAMASLALTGRKPSYDTSSTISQAPDEGFLGGILNKAKRGASGIMADLGHAFVNRSSGMEMPSSMLTENQQKNNRDLAFGIPSASADEQTPWGRAANPNNQPDIPTGYGSQGEIFYNGNTRMSPMMSDFATPGTRFDRPGSEQAYLRGEDPRISNDGNYGVRMDAPAEPPKQSSNPFGFPTAYADTNQNVQRREPDPVSEKEKQWQDMIDSGYVPTKEDIYGPIVPKNQFPTDGSMQSPTGTRQVASGRGMGAFGTGNGVQSDDPYMAEMKKALKGYGSQEKDVRNQFEDLIRALDPTYDQYNKDAKQGVDEELNQNLMKLAAVMNANNTGDSEQRAQLMSTQQSQALAKLADLMQKLNVQKQQDITGYKTKSVDAVNSIRQQRQTAQQNYAKMLSDSQQQKWDNNYKMASLGGKSTSAGSITYMGEDPKTGEPVYRNSKTGERVVGTGLVRKQDSLAQLFQALQGGGQQGGGSWEIDPQTGQQVWVTD